MDEEWQLWMKKRNSFQTVHSRRLFRLLRRLRSRHLPIVGVLCVSLQQAVNFAIAQPFAIVDERLASQEISVIVEVLGTMTEFTQHGIER